MLTQSVARVRAASLVERGLGVLEADQEHVPMDGATQLGLSDGHIGERSVTIPTPEQLQQRGERSAGALEVPSVGVLGERGQDDGLALVEMMAQPALDPLFVADGDHSCTAGATTG